MKKNFPNKVKEATQSVRKCVSYNPRVGIVLGSGLGAFVEQIKGDVIPYEKIKNFPSTSVVGHKGYLKINNNLAVYAGRIHYYEGHEVDDLVLPIFLLYQLGIETIILTNAAGAINNDLNVGDMVLIKDHINLMGINPLRGENMEQWGPRFPDCSEIYDHDLIDALMCGNMFNLKKGIYAAVTGPSYETPAEVELLRRLGADVVGMSTVPEALVANYLGIKVLGISCITNKAAINTDSRIDHQEVIDVGQKITPVFTKLLLHTIDQLGFKV